VLDIQRRWAHLHTCRKGPPNQGKPDDRLPLNLERAEIESGQVLTDVPYKVQFAAMNAARLAAIFFRTSNGREPVRDWLLSLPKEDRRQIGEDIAYVQFKWPIGKPRVDHLRASVWEVRSSLDNRIARTLFAVEGGRMVLLHGFIKKSQQTPDAEIELAVKRYKEWHRGEA
jgi:phage-related protein